MTTADLVSDGVVSVKEAVKFLSLSRTEVWRLIQAGKIRPLRSGRRILIPRRELTRFLESLAAA